MNGEEVAPILLIGQTYDAATPVSGNLEIRKRFPRSVYLEVEGGIAHAASLIGDECVDKTIANYLATGELPERKDGDRADALCDPPPPPDPEAEANTSALKFQAAKPLRKFKSIQLTHGRL